MAVYFMYIALLLLVKICAPMTNDAVKQPGQTIQIIPTGIKRHQEDFNCEDNGCEEVINLRYKNGTWKVVGEKDTYLTFPDGNTPTNLYYHDATELPNTIIKYFVGYTNSRSFVLYEFYTFTPLSLQSTSTILSLPYGETFLHFRSLKNILIITTDKDEYLFKWDSDARNYVRLSKNIKPDIKYGFEYRDQIFIEDKATQAELFDQIMIEKYKKRRAGKLSESFAVFQCAFKLWDGSYIMYSQPQIVTMTLDLHYSDYQCFRKRVDPGTPTNETYSVHLNCGIPIFWLKFQPGFKDNLEKYKGLITHFCIFMSQDVSRFLFEYSDNIFDQVVDVDDGKTYDLYEFKNNTESINQLMRTHPYYLAREVKFDDLINNDETYQYEIRVSDVTNVLNYNGDGKDSIDSVEKIPVRHNVYSWKRGGSLSASEVILAQTIALGPALEHLQKNYDRVWYTYEDAKPDEIQSEDDAGTFVLQAQPELPVDDFTNHNLVSLGNPYIYNAKIHKGNIKVKFGSGENYSCWYGEPAGTLGDTTGWTWYREIKIETDMGTRYVVEEFDPYVFVSFPRAYLIIPNVISYPDARATRIRLLCKTGAGENIYQLASYDLEAHKMYNFAYKITNKIEGDDIGGSGSDGGDPDYIAFDNAVITINSATIGTDFFICGSTAESVATENRYYTDKNRVQVSRINNALMYPSMFSYQIGDSETEVKCFASQSVPVSPGQFGQFPLSVFTSKGIWLMQQGAGDIVYSAVVPLNTEIAYKNSICELGGAIVYAAIDGVKVLSGNQVQHISKVVEGTPSEKLKWDSYYIGFIEDTDSETGHLVNLYPYLSEEDFLDYLDENVRIVHDNINRELIISNRDLFTNPGRASAESYSYVYNLEHQVWSKITDSFHQFLQIGGNWIGFKNYRSDYTTGLMGQYINRESAAFKDVMIQTRPMKWGTFDFKKMLKLVQRSVNTIQDGLYDPDNDDKFGLYLFASLDNLAYRFIKGQQISQAMGWVQHPSLMSARASHRHHVILCAVNTNAFNLSHWEVNFEPTLASQIGREARLNTEDIEGDYSGSGAGGGGYDQRGYDDGYDK